MAKKKSNKRAKSKGIASFLAILVVIVAAAILIVYIYQPQWLINLLDATEREYYEYVKSLYSDSPDDDSPDVDGVDAVQVNEGDLAEIGGSDLSIHFLELGNAYAGDCTLIKVGDTEVLIDAGSRKSSATTITGYINQYCTDGVLEYVVATHAHQDHIAGFVGNQSGNSKTGVLYQFDVETLIQFSNHNTSSNIYSSYVDAVEYLEDNGTAVYDAKECWYGENGAQKQYFLNEEKTISMNILYNYYYENATDDENDYSVCILLTQKLKDGKENNYLFTGDLEKKGEEYLVANNDLPECVLFKGGHHGSKTSSTDALLNKIKPEYVAVCCCAGSTEYTTTEENTFPTQAFIDRVSKHTQNIYVTTLCLDYSKREFTSMNGNIVFYFGKNQEEITASLKLWCSNNTTVLKDTDWFKQNRTWNGQQ